PGSRGRGESQDISVRVHRAVLCGSGRREAPREQIRRTVLLGVGEGTCGARQTGRRTATRGGVEAPHRSGKVLEGSAGTLERRVTVRGCRLLYRPGGTARRADRREVTDADQAVAALHDGLEAGWGQHDELKERDFDPIRKRADFQKLLAELEARAKKP